MEKRSWPLPLLSLLAGLLLAPSPAAETRADEDFSTPGTPDAPAGNDVEITPIPGAEPAPKATKKPTANLFRIPGAQAVQIAQAAGYCFSPLNGLPPRDGRHTTAIQFNNIITSEVDGVNLVQYQPPNGWNVPSISNTFYMFVDRKLRPAPLAPGWTIRGIQLKGPGWQWNARPAVGAPSASFSVTLFGYKTSATPTTVALVSLSLQGPPGATDWRAAFLPARTVQRR